MTAAVAVLSTAGSRDEAERLAATLVGERLAACVNVIAPIVSIYRWQGAVERGDEALLVIKTRRRLVPALIARLQALHSYDVPEAIVLPIESGSRSYLDWLIAETTPPVRARRSTAAPRRSTPARRRR